MKNQVSFLKILDNTNKAMVSLRYQVKGDGQFEKEHKEV
jgi:hypothetical protein